jgi:RNA-directed DNA polymerase
MKSSNDAAVRAKEMTEGRGSAKGNMDEHAAHRTQSRVRAPDALDRVREAARRDRKLQFTTLFHHVTVDRLRAAYLSLQRQAAAGVDGMTCDRRQLLLPGGDNYSCRPPSPS